ncbi:MAG: hypothetical protein IKQ57_05285, partial [Candidatus Methanomethylophilaceae archaeon]|nr:hypothetical protein [Candidatus Methanomethylophilaceae archaeon]
DHGDIAWSPNQCRGGYASHAEGIVPGICISIPEIVSHNLLVDQAVRRGLGGDAAASMLESKGLRIDVVSSALGRFHIGLGS